MSLTIPTETTFEEDAQIIVETPILKYRSKVSDQSPVDVSGAADIVVAPNEGIRINALATGEYSQDIPAVTVSTGGRLEFVAEVGRKTSAGGFRAIDDMQIEIVNKTSQDGFQIRIRRQEIDAGSNPYEPPTDERFCWLMDILEVAAGVASFQKRVTLDAGDLLTDVTFQLIFNATRAGVIASTGPECSYLHGVAGATVLDQFRCRVQQSNDTDPFNATYAATLKSVASWPTAELPFNPSGYLLASDFRHANGLGDTGDRVDTVATDSVTVGTANHVDFVWTQIRGTFEVQTLLDTTQKGSMRVATLGTGTVANLQLKMTEDVEADAIGARLEWAAVASRDFIAVGLGNQEFWDNDLGASAGAKGLLFAHGEISNGVARDVVWYWDGGVGFIAHGSTTHIGDPTDLEIRLVSQAGGNDEFAFYRNGVDLDPTIAHYTFIGGMVDGGSNPDRQPGFVADELSHDVISYFVKGSLP